MPGKKCKIPQKCCKCAMLTAEVAKQIHGVDGDNCWNPAVCYSLGDFSLYSGYNKPEFPPFTCSDKLLCSLFYDSDIYVNAGSYINS